MKKRKNVDFGKTINEACDLLKWMSDHKRGFSEKGNQGEISAIIKALREFKEISSRIVLIETAIKKIRTCRRSNWNNTVTKQKFKKHRSDSDRGLVLQNFPGRLDLLLALLEKELQSNIDLHQLPDNIQQLRAIYQEQDRELNAEVLEILDYVIKFRITLKDTLDCFENHHTNIQKLRSLEEENRPSMGDKTEELSWDTINEEIKKNNNKS